MKYAVLITCFIASISSNLDVKDNYWLHNFGDVTCFINDSTCEKYAAPIPSTEMWISVVNYKESKKIQCCLYNKERFICKLPDRFLLKLRDKYKKQAKKDK